MPDSPGPSHAGDSIVEGAAYLKKVTLIGFEQSWSQEGIVALVEAVPGLETLELTPLSAYHREFVLVGVVKRYWAV